MKLESPSELGPWPRVIEQTHETTSPQCNNTSTSLKPESILPRVNKPYLIKIREQKPIICKPALALKMRPLQLELPKSADELDTILDGFIRNRETKTLSLEPPKMSFYNKQKGFSDQAKGMVSATQRTVKVEEHSLEDNRKTCKKQISKVDLLADYNNGQTKCEQKSTKISKAKEYQFAKKRSLLQLLRYLKTTEQSQYQYQQMANPEAEHKEKERRGPVFGSSRYEGYRNLVNTSMQGESRYMPYFQARKSHLVSKRR